VQSISAVVAGPSGLVAVGEDSSKAAAAVWTSPDGITWSRVSHDEAVLGGLGSQSMNSVTLGGPGLVAVGSTWLFGVPDAVVWTSPDGTTWSRANDFGADFVVAEMTGVTSSGAGLVAVGATRPEYEFDLNAVVWVAATRD
jgi:hypothetical protein